MSKTGADLEDTGKTRPKRTTEEFVSLQGTASSVVTGTSGFRGREFSFRLLREERHLAVRRCGGLRPAGCVCSGGPLSFLDSQHLLIPDLLEESAPLEGNGGTALNLVLKACLPNEV